MSIYLALTAVSCVLVAEGRLQGFQLTRGLKDKFTNPQCDTNTVCSPVTCVQYFARCETKSCKVCVCDEQYPTYVVDEKRCVKDDDIYPRNVPKYSSFAISSSQGNEFLTVVVKNLHRRFIKTLQHTNKYTGGANQLWIYTKSHKLLNLGTLQCLDSQDKRKVTIRPCNYSAMPSQTWSCDSSGRLYNPGKKGVYLAYSGTEFYMTNDEYKWTPYQATGMLNRSICDVPDIYQGCYRFEDGSSVMAFPRHRPDQMRIGGGKDGPADTFDIDAPVFKQGNSMDCRLVQHASLFSINNQPWTKFTEYPRYISIYPYGMKPFDLEVYDKATIQWAGALVNLKIECKSSRGQKAEQHCLILKFDGVFNKTLHPLLSTPTHKSQPTPSVVIKQVWRNVPPAKQYKSSTIALSVVLGVIFIMMVVAVILMARKRINQAWATTPTNGTHDEDIKPFYDRDEQI